MSREKVCGVTKTHIYWSSHQPGRVLITDMQLHQLQDINFAIPKRIPFYPVFSTAIDSPLVHILGGNARALIRGDLNTQKFSVKYLKVGNFNNALPISDVSYIMRCDEPTIVDAVFKKIDINSETITNEDNLSEIKGDGGFAYDGTLQFDTFSSKLIYVCCYCNHITIFDTSLHLSKRSHTIDTCNTPEVKVARSNETITLSSPPVKINPRFCLFRGFLFIQSALKADNDNEISFKNNYAIDIYDEFNGDYEGSFYLPKYSGEQIRDFYLISSNYILVIYESVIAIYTLHLPFLN
jgi:hypothetical protein